MFIGCGTKCLCRGLGYYRTCIAVSSGVLSRLSRQFQDGEGELLPDIVHSVRIRTVQLLTHFSHQYSMISLCLLTHGAVGRKNQGGKRGMLYLQNAVVVFDFFPILMSL